MHPALRLTVQMEEQVQCNHTVMGLSPIQAWIFQASCTFTALESCFRNVMITFTETLPCISNTVYEIFILCTIIC